MLSKIKYITHLPRSLLSGGLGERRAMNSRAKGAKGEREIAKILRQRGYDARRGQRDGRFKPKGNIFITDDKLIYCLGANGELLFFTDLSIASKIVHLHWCKAANGYSATHINGIQIMAHRYILNADKDDIVDHKNRNKKDNTVTNLRICNKSENAYNSRRRNDNTSGHTGVWYRKDTGKWVAEIKNKYRKISLGCFKEKEDAVKAREAAERKYAREFRRVE